MRKAQKAQAAVSFRLENSPSRSTGRRDRMLKLCTSWERLSTQKAMVRPTTGSGPGPSNHTRPRV